MPIAFPVGSSSIMHAADNPASTGTDRTQLVLLGACVLALLGGLLFALLFKRR